MSGPLDGIVVLDFTLAMAGPFAAQKLGDLGADVIKIEPLGAGEWHRSHAAGNAWVKELNSSFIAFNRNKRSLSIDLKSPEAGSVIADLARRADVVIQNFRAGVADRLNIGYEALRSHNAQLVYCSMSGYGENGPLSGRPGQDLLLQGYSGAMWNVGRRGDSPQPSIYYAADAISAHLAVQGILAALLHRERVGEGQKVEVNMLNGVIDLQAQELSVYLTGGVKPERSAEPLAHALLPAPYGVYKTLDGYITLAMGALPDLADALGDDRIRAMDPESAGFTERDEISRIVSEVVATRSTAEWIATFDAHKLWAGPVYDYDDLLEDPQVIENEMIVEMDHPTEGPLRATGIPIRFSSSPGAIRRPPPMVGQHTDEILTFLGYSDQQVADLRTNGVVGGDSQPSHDHTSASRV